ncbi:MAG: sporulation transcriptional regulator SpoIIID, partial [Clostridia bacterium]|nr:sporulation transcriptional regulator SpoIIID [Clostridia bacterium]
MWDYITERVTREAEYIIETKSTVRSAAQHFDISKSTVHKDVTERLEAIDK